MSLFYDGMTITQERAAFTAGLTLQAIQAAENLFNTILTWVFPTQKPHDLASFFAMTDANKRSHLGRLLTDMRKRATINASFDDRLVKFIDDRNRFCHRLFTETDFMLETDAGSERAIAFMLALQGDAAFVQQILASFLVMHAKTSGDPDLIAFADEFIQTPGKPYDIITQSKDVFTAKKKP